MLRKASLFVLLLFIAACNRTPAESELPATTAPEAASPTETAMPTDPPEPTAEAALPVDATSLDGQWEGAIDIAGQQLDIIVKFDSSIGGLTATIDIPQQGAADLPLDEVLFFIVIPCCAILTLEAVRAVRGWPVGDGLPDPPAGGSS